MQADRAALRGVAAGCIVGIDGWIAHVQASNVVPDVAARDQGIARMLDVALDAIELLNRDGRDHAV